MGRELVSEEELFDVVIREFVVRFGWANSTCSRACQQDSHDVGRRMMDHFSGSPPWADSSLPTGSIIAT
jgi:hypothetical protein